MGIYWTYKNTQGRPQQVPFHESNEQIIATGWYLEPSEAAG